MADGIAAAAANTTLDTLGSTYSWIKLHTGAPGSAGTAFGVGTGQLGGLTGAGHAVGNVVGTAHGNLGALSGHATQHVADVVSTGSWYELLSITQEFHDLAAEDRARGPVACPNDGEPLTSAPDGGLFCRYDGWRPT